MIIPFVPDFVTVPTSHRNNNTFKLLTVYRSLKGSKYCTIMAMLLILMPYDSNHAFHSSPYI